MFLSFLHREGYITNDISRRVITPFADNPIPRVLTQFEYQRLLKAGAGNASDAAILETFLQTGIRLSELVGLTINDVEITSDEKTGEKREIMRIKNGAGRKDRLILLNSEVCDAMDRHLNTQPAPNSLSLFTNRFGNPLGDLID